MLSIIGSPLSGESSRSWKFTSQIRLSNCGLQLTDNGAELARSKETGPDGAGQVLTNSRERSQGGANLWRHVVKLPADLDFEGVWTVRGCESDGLSCVRGGPQCVSAHMADTDGLSGGSGCSRCGGNRNLTHSDATNKSTANLVGGVQIPPSERSGPGDENSRAVVIWIFNLK